MTLPIIRLPETSIVPVREKLKAVVDLEINDDASSLLGLEPQDNSGSNRSNRLSFSIRRFNSHGRIIDFLEAIEQRNPAARDVVNGIVAEHLKDQFEAIGKDLAASNFGVIGRGHKDISSGEGKTALLQRLVQNEVHSIDHAALVFRVFDAGARVCRIERDDGSQLGKAIGTGFLVGTDLVLTNWHVMQIVETGGIPASAVRCRFDYQMDETGTVRSPGSTVPISVASWKIADSPFAPFDDDPSGRKPTKDELDYCFVKLSKAVGDDMTSIQRPRRWYDLERPIVEPVAGSDLTVVGHCDGKPLVHASGRLLGYVCADLRLRHDAYTLPGSSGSPVFDRDYRLVALHHAGDPDQTRPAEYNQAIPMKKILEHSRASREGG